MDWPEITHDHTLRRLAAPVHELPSFQPEWAQLVNELNLREFDEGLTFEERKAFGLGYPWPEEVRDVVIEGDQIVPGYELDDGVKRFPLLAFGANAVPHRLAVKFRGLDPTPIRIRPAWLEDFDVVGAPVVTPYGSVPAELSPSPGTSVRIAIIWATDAQIERLTFTEFGYQFGLLDDIKLTIEGEPGPTAAFGYVSRAGGFNLDGELVALSAVEAENRRFKAMTQLELLTEFATLLLGEGAEVDALLRELHDREHYGTLMRDNIPMLLRRARPIEPYPKFIQYSLR